MLVRPFLSPCIQVLVYCGATVLVGNLLYWAMGECRRRGVLEFHGEPPSIGEGYTSSRGCYSCLLIASEMSQMSCSSP